MRPLFIVALTTAAVLSSAAGLRAQPPARAARRPVAREKLPRLVAASVFDKMYFKERAESDISPAALAAYGNALVARSGLDFMFDACGVWKANPNAPRAPAVSEWARVFTYTLRRAGGADEKFQLVGDVFLNDLTGGMCGECLFEVPALRVSKTEMHVVAEGGRRFLLERPAGFLLQEAGLVDEPSEKVRRTWQLPYQTTPLGLSPDRTKLYVPLPNFDDVEWDDKLAVEISGAGVRLVARAGLSLPKYERTADAPGREGVSLIRYGAGRQSYVLRLTDPCT